MSSSPKSTAVWPPSGHAYSLYVLYRYMSIYVLLLLSQRNDSQADLGMGNAHTDVCVI